jgi:MerR family transcriptional regulator, light-induced transcriptional regulator
MDYPIRAVSQITGLSIDTLRAWERRYGAVKPLHAARGRMYGEGHLHRLSLLRDLVNRGHAISLVAGLADGELRRLLGGPGERPSALPAGEFDAIFIALEQYDAAAVADELGRYASVLSNRDLIFRVALPLMREVGERWHGGRLSIASEHMASQALRSLLGSLLRLQSLRPGAPAIALAAPPEEWHEFGILSSAVLAASLGLRVIYLGPNTPADEVVRVAAETGVRAVVLGITQVSLTPDFGSLDAQLPPATEIWLGGPAAPSEPERPRTRTLRNLEDLEIQCHRILGDVI